MKVEKSFLSGEITETKEIDVNGVPVGVVCGYMATWQPDAYDGVYGMPDRIMPGAYAESIAEHKGRNNRQIRLKEHHSVTIGGFPIDYVREDNVGLYGEGHINLSTQQGREAYALAKQGVLVDFSIGHIVTEDNIKDDERVILRADIIEASIVDEPKNRYAVVTEVKSGKFADLPIAQRDYKWDEESARERVLELKFRHGNGADAFVGGHIIADVVDDKLMVIPAAIHMAAEEVKSSDDKSAQAVLEQYFGKMNVRSPFGESAFYTVDDVKDWSNADFKSALLDTGMFSNGAARALIAKHRDQNVSDPNKSLSSLLEKIVETTKVVNNEV